MGGPADRQVPVTSPFSHSTCLLGTQLTSCPWKSRVAVGMSGGGGGQGGPFLCLRESTALTFLPSSCFPSSVSYPESLARQGLVQHPELQLRDRLGRKRELLSAIQGHLEAFWSTLPLCQAQGCRSKCCVCRCVWSCVWVQAHVTVSVGGRGPPQIHHSGAAHSSFIF